MQQVPEQFRLIDISNAPIFNRLLFSFAMSSTAKVAEEATIIYAQLGGPRFWIMTGAHYLSGAARNDSNPNPWLRVSLYPDKNKAGANRMKITLMPTDTYKVEFYHQKLVDLEPIITKKQVFEMVYGEDLQRLFTNVTGLYTSL